MRCVHRTCGLRQKMHLVLLSADWALQSRNDTRHFFAGFFCRYRATSHIEIPALIPDGPLEIGPTEIVPSTIRIASKDRRRVSSTFRAPKQKTFSQHSRQLWEGLPRSVRHPNQFEPRKRNDTGVEYIRRPNRVPMRRPAQGLPCMVRKARPRRTSDKGPCCNIETLVGVLAAAFRYRI